MADRVLLAERLGIAATDGSGGVSASMKETPAGHGGLWAQAAYTVTGSPTGVEVRVAIDGSSDGVNFHELVRFGDQTSTSGGMRLVRMASNTAVTADAAAAMTSLDTADAAPGTVSDGTLPPFLRARTKLQTLTGGTSPTVSIVVTAGRV